MIKIRKPLLSAAWAAPFLIATAFWWWYTVHSPAGNLLDMGRAARWIAIGSLAGLFTATGALLQVLLIGRARWLERVFGLDRLTVIHRYNAVLTFLFLVTHVFLVTQGHAAKELPPLSFWGQVGVFLTTWDDLPAAAAGAAVLLAVGLISLSMVKRRVKYELWYYLHLAVYVAIALAFGHQFEHGTGLTQDTSSRAFAWYWYGLYAFCFGNLLVYRVAIPLVRYARHRFVVSGVEAETPDVTSVYIQGRNLHALPARAGQFVFVRFMAPGFRWEKHPFSLSRRPDGKCLRLSIKKVGDFTGAVPNLKPGTPVLLDGPHGVFTADPSARPKVLLLAAGIGITPLRSLAEELGLAGRDVILLYGNHNERAIVFRAELAELEAKSPSLKVIHVLSQPSDWPGERGHIDEEKLRRTVPDLIEREVFLCGPAGMMVALRKTLAALGVPRARIHYEQFSL